MNETMGSIIMRLRKEQGLTQEQLANALGISYQAVSKWETGNSCPDIATLPLLADLFSVSIDSLFGRESVALAPVEQNNSPAAPVLPWPDDDSFYAVLYHGHELIGRQAVDTSALHAQQSIRFEYEGPAQNLTSAFDVQINGTVYGDVNAGGDVNCGDVAGSVGAEGDVTCDTVAGGVEAGGNVTCDSVGGAVNAAGDVTCDDVCGNIRAGGDVTCDDVQGSVSAGGDVNCDSVRGAAFGSGFSADTVDRAMDELDQQMDHLGERLNETFAGLGDRIADAVEKNRKRSWSFHKKWPFGGHQVEVDVDLDLDDEEESDTE